jgi:FMN-dependent NADH-azoreductase
MPSSFKAYVDMIVRTGITYVVAGDDRYVGQLGGKRVLFITTRGTDLSEGSAFAGMDALTPSLRAAFGFIGVDRPHFIDAQPVQFADPATRVAALGKAKAELAALAGHWGSAAATLPRAQ